MTQEAIEAALIQVLGAIAVEILECPDAAKLFQLAQRYNRVKARFNEQGGFTPEQPALLIAKLDRDVSKPPLEVAEINLSVFESVVST